MIKKRVHHIDANHSWLQVPDTDLGELGLEAGDFAYAPTDGSDLFLSEDEEMGQYQDAAEAAGWQVVPEPRHYHDRCTFIRNLPWRDPHAEDAILFRILETRA